MTVATPPQTRRRSAPPNEEEIARFEWLVPTLAPLCERFGRPLDRSWAARAGRFYAVPGWVRQGSVSHGDAMFLYAMVRLLRPPMVVEIGVASGCSTAVLACAMADEGLSLVDDRGGPVVHGFDVLDHVYFDPGRPVGCAVRDMAPDLLAAVRIHAGLTARDAGAMFAGRRLPFAFIDANHNHPWTTADLLALAPALAPGAWVAIHDVALERIAHEHAQRVGAPAPAGGRGPRMLHEWWPWEKIVGAGDGYNIAAVRMPDQPLRRAALAGLLDGPWDCRPSAALSHLLDGVD